MNARLTNGAFQAPPNISFQRTGACAPAAELGSLAAGAGGACLRVAVGALLLAIAVVARATPQEGASILVVVRDVNGTALPGALVSLHRIPAPEEVATPDQVRGTGNAGCARLDEVSPGEYTLTVELSGWATVVVGPFYRWAVTTRQSPEQPEKLVIVMNPIQQCGSGESVENSGR